MKIKPVSILAITIVGLMSAFPSNGAQMTSQIQRLLDQKEEKIKKLEECEGKRKGWMIAGISTIGVTAVGVGVNIAQAGKSNKLDDEIYFNKQQLERQQETLSRIESNIAKKEQEKAGHTEQERGRMETQNQAGSAEVSAPIQAPSLDDHPKLGGACGDGKTWVQKDNGGNVCIDETPGQSGKTPCECESVASVKPSGGEKPKEESSLQKCLRERNGNRDGAACCYLSKSVATWNGTNCVCADAKEFSIGSNGRGKCTASNRDAVIAGYCLNQEGDAGDLDYSKKTFCWCDIHIQNYCSQSKLFDDNTGVCSGNEHGNNTVCQTFCESKKSALIKICDDLR